MSFNLKKKKPFENISKTLKKLIDSELYARIGQRINGTSRIDELSDKFFPVLIWWSFEAAYCLFIQQEIFSTLKGGKTIRELLFDLDWKNADMLEDLLDTLVDHEVLAKQGREYHLNAISEQTGALEHSKLAEISLKETDNLWLDRSSDYQPFFSFYDRLLSGHMLETLVSGSPSN